MGAVMQRKVYDDWSGGHWGSNGPFKATPGQYRAINLQVYANGTIGPRPGWKERTTTGTGPNIVAGAGQEFYGIIWLSDDTDGGDLLFVSGNDASETLKLKMSTLTWSTTTLGIPSTVIVNDPNGYSFAYENTNNVVVGATKIYNKDTDATTTISYPDSFSPTRAVFFGARLYAWGDTTYPNRIYYSNADSYDFVSGQYFNVGPGGGAANLRSIVMQAFPIKDLLLFYVLPSSTTDKQLAGEWWTLTGANPISGTLRRVGRDIYPTVPNLAAVYRDSVLFVDHIYEQAGIAIHDGTSLNTQALPHLGPRSGSDSGTATAGLGSAVSYGVPSVIFPYRIGDSWKDETGTSVGEEYDNGLQGWELVNRVWTKASYWQGAIDEVVTNDRRFLWGICPWDGDKLVCVTNTSSDGSGTYRVFTRDICLNRPATVGSTHSSESETHTDLSGVTGIVGQLWLPPVMDDNNSSVRVRRVIVEFDYWKNAHFTDAPALELKIGQYRIERGEFTLSEAFPADLSALADSTGRLPSRARITIPVSEMPFASAAQVRFTSVTNIAIDRVSVDYYVNPEDVR